MQVMVSELEGYLFEVEIVFGLEIFIVIVNVLEVEVVFKKEKEEKVVVFKIKGCGCLKGVKNKKIIEKKVVKFVVVGKIKGKGKGFGCLFGFKSKKKVIIEI